MNIETLQKCINESDIEASIHKDKDMVSFSELRTANAMELAELWTFAYDCGFNHVSFMASDIDNGSIDLVKE